MLTIIVIIIYYSLFHIFIKYNYSNVATQYVSAEIILIDSSLIDRMGYVKTKIGRNLKKNKMIYIEADYRKYENDLSWIGFSFFLVQCGIFFLVYRFIFLDRLNFQVILNGVVIFLLNYMLGIEILHYYFRKKKRQPLDAILVLLMLMVTSIDKYKSKGNIFIGKLIFLNDCLITGVANRGKNLDLEQYTLSNKDSILCQYNKKTIQVAVKLKDITYENEFSKFIFESDQVEKGYFEALYEFPFMERSTVYDFERLHHDIMQDLADEERTFYFKDYLIK